MSGNSPRDVNPYQAPAAPTAAAPRFVGDGVDRKLIKKFRQQVLALGVFWIVIGALSLGATILLLSFADRMRSAAPTDITAIMAISGAIGAFWLVLGALTCAKQMWAVRIGLVLSYLALVAQVGSFVMGSFGSILLAIIMLFVILQAHRVLGWAKKIRAAGLPLTIRPEEIGESPAGFAPPVRPAVRG